jgi:O-antigen/teichoic acid export membrane protein
MIRKTFNAGILLSAGGVVGQGLAFGRNIIIGRSLGVEEFGIASTYVIAGAFLALLSDVSINKLLVQSPNGGTKKYLGTAHSLSLFNHVFTAVGLLLCARWFAEFFESPDRVAEFYWLAAIPLIKGFQNLRLIQVQRGGVFRPGVITGLVSQITATAVALPLCLWLDSAEAVIWILVIQSISLAIASHVMADQKFRFAWDMKQLTETLRFGLPLMLNGLMLFLAMQGDRLVVLRGFNLETLGWFSVGLLLVTVPIGIVLNVFGSLLLPIVSRSANRGESFSATSGVILFPYAMLGVVAVLGYCFFADQVVQIAYGDEFMQAAVVLPWLGVGLAVRLLRGGLTLMALSKGNSVIPLIGGVFRISGFGLSILAVSSGGGVIDVAIAMCFGEVVGFMATGWLLHKNASSKISDLILPLVVVLTAFVAALVIMSSAGAVGGIAGILMIILAIVVLIHRSRAIVFLASLRSLESSSTTLEHGAQ